MSSIAVLIVGGVIEICAGLTGIGLERPIRFKGGDPTRYLQILDHETDRFSENTRHMTTVIMGTLALAAALTVATMLSGVTSFTDAQYLLFGLVILSIIGLWGRPNSVDRRLLYSDDIAEPARTEQYLEDTMKKNIQMHIISFWCMLILVTSGLLIWGTSPSKQLPVDYLHILIPIILTSGVIYTIHMRPGFRNIRHKVKTDL